MISETVKGFSDFTGEEALKREKIIGILQKNFKVYGFEPAETPIVEFEEFVRGENEFDEAVSDIFKLKDKGERKLALRYELTFSLKRIAQNKKMPYKRYQIGAVFRDEPVSGNRLRQFTQADIDVIGSTIKEEAEVLVCASKIMKELGIEAEIQVNSRKLMNSAIKSLGIDNVEFVLRELDKVDKQGEDFVKMEMNKFIDKERIVKLFKLLGNKISFFRKFEGYKEMKRLIELCREYGLELQFKPMLARGLSYYNGSVFELKTKEIKKLPKDSANGNFRLLKSNSNVPQDLKMKETIAGGGSYSVNNSAATGISFGLERLSQLAKIKLDDKRVLIISISQDEKAINLAEKLRKNKIVVSISDKVSKGLDYANSYGYNFVIFIGSDEVKKKKFKLRDMNSGKEEFLGEREILERLK